MVRNDAENRDRDWGETLTPDRVRKTLTPRVADFFADFAKKKPTVLQSRGPEQGYKRCFEDVTNWG